MVMCDFEPLPVEVMLDFIQARYGQSVRREVNNIILYTFEEKQYVFRAYWHSILAARNAHFEFFCLNNKPETRGRRETINTFRNLRHIRKHIKKHIIKAQICPQNLLDHLETIRNDIRSYYTERKLFRHQKKISRKILKLDKEEFNKNAISYEHEKAVCEFNFEKKSASEKLNKRIEEIEKKISLNVNLYKKQKRQYYRMKKNGEVELKTMKKIIRQTISELSDWSKIIKFYPLINDTYYEDEETTNEEVNEIVELSESDFNSDSDHSSTSDNSSTGSETASECYYNIEEEKNYLRVQYSNVEQ